MLSSKGLLLSCSLAIAFSCGSSDAAPKFTLTASTTSVEKGHVFEIYVAIETDEALESVTLSPLAPENFTVTPKSLPGIVGVKARDDGSITVSPVTKGSSLTIPFRVKPPAQFRWPFSGKEEESLDTTRDKKVFAFNVSYAQQTESETVHMHQTEYIALRYTTSLIVYLLTGIIGVLLGFIVKTITQDRELITAAVRESRIKVFENVRIVLRHFLIARLPSLVTAVAIGFGVLLALAQDTIPANGWFHAVGLGMGIGIFGDEKLISKLPSPGGSG